MSLPEENSRCCLYNQAQLDGVLQGMAHQAAAHLSPFDQVALVGIVRRGLPLAEMLQQRLAPLRGGRPMPVHPLRLKRYADDLTLLHPETALTENPAIAALDFERTAVLMVDDVLYAGFSLLRAAAWLVQVGARHLRTAMLVDRGAAQVPVRADIVGVRLDVAPGDVVECHVPPYEPDFRIEVCRGARG